MVKPSKNNDELNPRAVKTVGKKGFLLSRKRPILWGLLLLQLFLLFLLFPFLLVYVENDYLRQTVQDAPHLESPAEPRFYSYLDGLYWTLITPIAVNSNENWPKSDRGWLLVRISDVTKILTVGVGAGLVHDTMITGKIRRLSRLIYQRSRRSKDDDGRIEFESKQQQISSIINGQPPAFNGQRYTRSNGTNIKRDYQKEGDDEEDLPLFDSLTG